MLHGAPEKAASSPAAEWLRTPLAHLPKDGGDIDSGKPLARPVYRPDVYARMVWWEAMARGLAVCGWAELGSAIQCMRLSADDMAGSGGARYSGLTLGGDEIAGADTWTAIERMVWWEAGAHGMAICRWAGFGQRRRCLRTNADGLVRGGRGAWNSDPARSRGGAASSNACIQARMVWRETGHAVRRSGAAGWGKRTRFRSDALRPATVLAGARNRSLRFHRSKNRLYRVGQPVCRLFGILVRSSSRGARRARGTLQTPLPYRWS